MIGPCLSACFAGVTGRDRYTLGFVADVAINMNLTMLTCLPRWCDTVDRLCYFLACVEDVAVMVADATAVVLGVVCGCYYQYRGCGCYCHAV